MKKKFIILVIITILLSACSTKNVSKDSDKEKNSDSILKCITENKDIGQKTTNKFYFDKETGKYKNQDVDVEAIIPSEDYANKLVNSKNDTCSIYADGGECNVSKNGNIVIIKIRKGFNIEFEGMTKEEIEKIINKANNGKCS